MATSPDAYVVPADQNGAPQLPVPVPQTFQADARRLVDLLATPDPTRLRWVSLWRRTDPLGMQLGATTIPAATNAPDIWVDCEAEEIDTSGYLALVGEHSDYPHTIAYRFALEWLSRPGHEGFVPAVDLRDRPSADRPVDVVDVTEDEAKPDHTIGDR